MHIPDGYLRPQTYAPLYGDSIDPHMNPDVLLLDEPTNGLDPRTQYYPVELILAPNKAGETIVIATP
jgi:ABC-type cobalamin transport system ATPase subunit